MLRPLLTVSVALATLTGQLPSREPGSVGMSAERLAAVDRIMHRGVSGGGFPGAALVIGRDGFAVLDRGYGHLGWSTSGPAVSPSETIYDLASLTKVIGTTTAAMILYDEGKLPLDAPVRQFLPEFSGGLKDKVTIRELLSHHSGLPAGRILWHRASNPADARRLVLQTPLECTPGKCYEYSDLGADVLGWVIENISGEPLDTFLAERVFGPLHMDNTMFKPAASLRGRIAPTAETSRRGRELRGEVNDESAYVLGGVAGHAGLFSTADDLALFAQMMLNRGELNGTRIVSPSTVDVFTTEQADARALGWELGNHVHGAGQMFGPHAYGHTGYTGTSLWIDPDRQMFVVLLTNRVYASHTRRSADAIADVRNDVADAAALSVTGDPSLPVYAMPTAFRSDTAQTWNRISRPAWRTLAERRSGPRPESRPEPPRLSTQGAAASGAAAETAPGATHANVGNAGSLVRKPPPANSADTAPARKPPQLGRW